MSKRHRLAFLTKEFRHGFRFTRLTTPEPNPWTGLMHFSALTFGTLLSSQGSDAHHRRSLDLSPGQPSVLYRFRSAQSRACWIRFPACLSGRVPHWAWFGWVSLPGVWSVRPLPRPALAPTRITLCSAGVKSQIGSAWIGSQACNLLCAAAVR